MEQLKKKICGIKYYRTWNLLLGTFLVTIVEKPSSWFPCIEAFREVRPKKRNSCPFPVSSLNVQLALIMFSFDFCKLNYGIAKLYLEK